LPAGSRAGVGKKLEIENRQAGSKAGEKKRGTWGSFFLNDICECELMTGR